MIVKIRSDLGRIDDDVDSEALEMLSRPDPRDHEELRRSEGAAADDYLTPRVKPLLDSGATNDDADRLSALEQDAPRLGFGKDREVRRGRRLQIRPCGVVSTAILLKHLIGADALLRGAIEIRIAPESRLDCGLDEGFDRRIAVAEIADVKRSADAMPRVRAARVVFRALEVGKNVRPAPALAPERGPFVVVLRLAPRVNHRIDEAAAAEPAPAWLIALAPAEPRLRR